MSPGFAVQDVTYRFAIDMQVISNLLLRPSVCMQAKNQRNICVFQSGIIARFAKGIGRCGMSSPTVIRILNVVAPRARSEVPGIHTWRPVAVMQGAKRWG